MRVIRVSHVPPSFRSETMLKLDPLKLAVKGVVVFSVNAGVYTACTGTLSERVDTAPHCSSGPFMYLCAGRMRFVKGLGLPAPFVIPWIWNYPCNY